MQACYYFAMAEVVFGYSFTDTWFQVLNEKGFTLSFSQVSDLGAKVGVLAFSEKSDDPSFLQLIEVIEEEKFLSANKRERLLPHVREASDPIFPIKIDSPPAAHANTCFKFLKSIYLSQLPEIPLKEFLRIRKESDLVAVHLQCADWKKFLSIAKPDHLFSFDGNDLALVHLGTTCFDIVVSI